jgi:hypothetical protein
MQIDINLISLEEHQQVVQLCYEGKVFWVDYVDDNIVFDDKLFTKYLIGLVKKKGHRNVR